MNIKPNKYILNRLIILSYKGTWDMWDREGQCFQDPDQDARYRDWLAAGGPDEFLACLPEDLDELEIDYAGLLLSLQIERMFSRPYAEAAR